MRPELYDQKRDLEAQAIIDGLTEQEALDKWENNRHQKCKQYEPAYRHLKNEALGVKS